MQTIEVSAAIIRQERKIYCTRRGHGKYQGFWEFPGGKIEAGETPAEALVREIKEELDLEIEVNELVEIVEYDYPDFHLHMYCYFCRIIKGEPKLIVHEAARWLGAHELGQVIWLPADIALIEKLKNMI